MAVRGGDTIVAVATPRGEGAIAVVRVSGPAAVEIVEPLFRGNLPLREAPGHTIHYGSFSGPGGELLDHVLVSVFLSPHSYTGEDTVEISCHGGSLLTGEILSVLVEAGARQADPGEFTRRAFLNGKIDLTQAEAVADLIAARSEMATRASVDQLSGSLGSLIRQIRTALVDLCSMLELGLDFSEDGIEIISNEEIEHKIKITLVSIDSIVSLYGKSRILRDGVSAAIVGRPNVGKSSLFNALLFSDRAIVTHLPGTTRDTIEEAVQIDGILFRLVDTAGIREPGDIVESEGIRRTFGAMRGADILALVTDANAPDSGEDIEFFLKSISQGQKYIIVRNKIDLVGGVVPGRRPEKPHEVWISATSGIGMDEVRALLVETAIGESGGPQEPRFIINDRHRFSLSKAGKQLLSALESTQKSSPPEFIALDIRASLDSLGEITGEVTTDEILNNIFSSFCVGK